MIDASNLRSTAEIKTKLLICLKQLKDKAMIKRSQAQTLSKFERSSLINQMKILAKFDQRQDFGKFVKILERGFIN